MSGTDRSQQLALPAGGGSDSSPMSTQLAPPAGGGSGATQASAPLALPAGEGSDSTQALTQPALPASGGSGSTQPSNQLTIAPGGETSAGGGSSAGDTTAQQTHAAEGGPTPGADQSAAGGDTAQSSRRHQTRAATAALGVATFESLPTTSRSGTDIAEREKEVERILSIENDEDVLGNYYLAYDSDAYKALSQLVHPDNFQANTDIWKKANEAQSRLNECHTRFGRPQRNDLPDDTRSKADRVYQNFWNSNIINGTVRHLQHNPTDATAWAVIRLMNEKIKQLNIEQRRELQTGTFPTTLFYKQYISANNLWQRIQSETNGASKEAMRIEVRNIYEDTQGFVDEYGLPKTWAWEFADINNTPAWYTEAVALRPAAAPQGPNLGVPGPSSANAGDDIQVSGDSTQETGSNTQGSESNSQDPEGDTQMNEGSSPDGDLQASATPAVNTVTDEPGIDPTSSGDTNMTDSNSNDVAPNGEEIEWRRNVGRHVQYLIRDDSTGTRIWKSRKLYGSQNPDEVPSLPKPTRDFIFERKNKYDGIQWIAMGVDDAVTYGAGRYPSILIMPNWLDNDASPPMWRSDVIRVAGRSRVDEDLMAHLPYSRVVTHGGRTVTVRSIDATGLIRGEKKAIDRILEDQLKQAKAAQSSSSATAQVAPTAPATSQQAPAQSTSTQAMPAQPTQPASTQPASTQPAPAPTTSAQSAQPVVAQPAPAQDTATEAEQIATLQQTVNAILAHLQELRVSPPQQVAAPVLAMR